MPARPQARHPLATRDPLRQLPDESDIPIVIQCAFPILEQHIMQTEEKQ